jgi:hypothetical protein
MLELLLESSMYTKRTSGLVMEIMPSSWSLATFLQPAPSTNGSELAASIFAEQAQESTSLHFQQQHTCFNNLDF